MANCVMYGNWETSVRVFFKIRNEIRPNKEEHHFPKSEITRTKSSLFLTRELLMNIWMFWTKDEIEKEFLSMVLYCSVKKKKKRKFRQWASFHSRNRIIKEARGKIKWRREENLIEFLNVILISLFFSITRIFFGNEFKENSSFSIFLHRSNAIISHDEIHRYNYLLITLY